MKTPLVALVLMAVFFTSACRLGGQGSDPTPPLGAEETSSPRFRLELPKLQQPSTTPTPTHLASATPTRTLVPTRTPRPTNTPTSTATPTLVPKVNLLIATCDTSVDLLSRLGEVTNAYIVLQNVGQTDVNDIEIILSASDEQGSHPDKTYHIQHLPAGYRIAIKLTVDTEGRQDTDLTAVMEGAPAIHEEARKSGCTRRTPDQQVIESLGELFILHRVER